MNKKFLRETGATPSEIDEILSKFQKYGFFNIEEVNKVADYKNSLASILGDKEFYMETMGNAHEFLSEVESEFEKVEFIPLGNGVVTSIMRMHGQMNRPFELHGTGYSNNPFFDFKRLVEMVNAYWEIDEPYKAPSKIGYGWKFCMEKSNPRAYLFACIRNYLFKNGVEFEMIDVKRICGLEEVWEDY